MKAYRKQADEQSQQIMAVNSHTTLSLESLFISPMQSLVNAIFQLERLHKDSAGLLLQSCVMKRIVAIFTPLFTQIVVDDAIVAGDRDFIKVLGTGFAFLMIFNVTVSAVRTWLSVYLGTHVNLQLVSAVFQRLIRLPDVFFERRSLGNIVSRFESTAFIQRTLTSSFIEGILDGFMSLLTLAILFAYRERD